MAVDYVCPVHMVSDGLPTCDVEKIVEEVGVTVVGRGRETIQCSSRGAHLCRHLVYFEDRPESCSPDALVWLEGCASDQC